MQAHTLRVWGFDAGDRGPSTGDDDDNENSGDEGGDRIHRGGFVLSRRLAEWIQNVHRREMGSVIFKAEGAVQTFMVALRKVEVDGICRLRSEI